jgi:hypothetical protein
MLPGEIDPNVSAEEDSHRGHEGFKDLRNWVELEIGRSGECPYSLHDLFLTFMASV